MSSKELLAEYATLATKLRHINETLQEINSLDVVQLIDKIRVVERKMGLVYTLFRSSVYSVLAQDQDQQQQQSPYSQQDEFQGEAQSSSSTTNPGRSSLGLNGSNGESDGYANNNNNNNNNNSNNNNGNHNKDRLLSSTGGQGEEEYDLGGRQSDHERLAPFQSNNAEDDYGARSTHKVAASSSSLASAPMPQTPSRYRSNHHPYHHYRSDPLLESTYRRTTLAAAHAAAAANAASSSSSASASALSRANTSGVTTFQSAAAGGGAMPQRRTSNVLDQFEAMTGQRSLLSLSRGHGRRPYDNGTSSSSSTNRPRYI
ncbi:hypothetical protein DFQ27_000962 [Actinomortierella ambigua]|uniref:DASH complex subunit DAD3 n=1 Tax=Actinomortierella ambigua TaxID=1343610 RepID=A0A9P6QF39_9FUNG|nr:hypothetical protein DFQ27_000962 [Actinomortierella ambigua]